MAETLISDASTLVLSGGGMNGFNLLGALAYLKDKSYLENVQTVIGTSVGGILGYLLCIGYSPIEIVVYFETKNIGKTLGHFNVMNILTGGGASSYSPLQTHLEKMTISKVGQFMTMDDLKTKLGKRLVLCTYNLTENRAEYITPETHGSLPCLAALRMTSNLPFIFEEFKYMSSYYIDGGIIDNFPILEAEENEKVLGIALDPTTKYKKDSDETNFMEYVFHLMMIPVNKDMDVKITEATKRGYCVIKLTKRSFTDFIDFSMRNKETLDLFSDGYNDAKHFYEGL
jgi:NTE family protein